MIARFIKHYFVGIAMDCIDFNKHKLFRKTKQLNYME